MAAIAEGSANRSAAADLSPSMRPIGAAVWTNSGLIGAHFGIKLSQGNANGGSRFKHLPTVGAIKMTITVRMMPISKTTAQIGWKWIMIAAAGLFLVNTLPALSADRSELIELINSNTGSLSAVDIPERAVEVEATYAVAVNSEDQILLRKKRCVEKSEKGEAVRDVIGRCVGNGGLIGAWIAYNTIISPLNVDAASIRHETSGPNAIGNRIEFNCKTGTPCIEYGYPEQLEPLIKYCRTEIDLEKCPIKPTMLLVDFTELVIQDNEIWSAGRESIECAKPKCPTLMSNFQALIEEMQQSGR